MQTVLAGTDEEVPRKWLRMMSIWPPSTPAHKTEFTDLLTSELDGYVCIADPPGSLLVPELLGMYPDAKVLVTIREKKKWAVSMQAIRRLIIPSWIATTLYFWVPVLRLMPAFWDTLPGIFVARHGQLMEDDLETLYRVYDAHHRWLEETVPREKLFYVDVKEGWGPMCEALGVEVPVGVEFPRLNESKDMEEMFKAFAVQGLIRWGMVVGGLAVVGGGVWWWL